MKPRRFVLLDRDGTTIFERHYLSDPEQVELIPRVAAGLRRLSEIGLGLAVVTNQSAIGRGFFDEAQLDLIHRRMCELLEAERVHLAGIYFCPHTPADGCPCRKPRPGLLERAAAECNFDLKTSFVIGDKPCDIEAGRAVGAATFLVRTGYGAQVAANPEVFPDYVVGDVWEAARAIERLTVAGQGMAAGAAMSRRTNGLRRGNQA